MFDLDDIPSIEPQEAPQENADHAMCFGIVARRIEEFQNKFQKQLKSHITGKPLRTENQHSAVRVMPSTAPNTAAFAEGRVETSLFASSGTIGA